MLRIRQLKIKGCRGIFDVPELKIETGGLILCGDNGTGKSSFIDAIEMALVKKCGAIERNVGGKKVAGLTWNKHGKHIRSLVPPEATVILTDGTLDYPISIVTDEISQKNEIKKFLQACKMESFILRRISLLRFIDAQPHERYQELSGFFNLDLYNKFEQALKKLTNSIEDKVTEVKRKIEEIDRNLKEILDVGELNQTLCVNSINKKLKDLPIAEIQSSQEIQTKIEEIEVFLKNNEGFKEYVEISALNSAMDNATKLADLFNLWKLYSASWDSYETESLKLKGNFFEEVLNKGLAWIEMDKLEKCPLCEKDILNLQDLRNRINTRLHEHAELIKLKNEFKKHEAAFFSKSDSYESEWSKINKKCAEMKIANPLINIITIINAQKSKIKEAIHKVCYLSIFQDITQEEAESNLKVLCQNIDERFQKIKENQKLVQVTEVRDFLINILASLKKRSSYLKYKKAIEERKTILDEIKKLAEKARKSAVKKLVTRISSIADEFFQEIHKVENIGNLTLDVSDRGQGSLTLNAVFYDEEDCDPRGFYSEGHLDSLGLCIFLAIRKFHSQITPELKILVLDDVLHSIDGSHRRETANLIFNKFKDHQIIVTTHDPLWFEYLKQAKSTSGAKYTVKKLASWTIDAGPEWGDHLSDYEWLTSATFRTASNSDKANRAGRFLEDLLQNLCHNLKIPVPYDISGRYTLDPLWAPFYSKVKGKLKNEALIVNVLTEIDQLRTQRNLIGAHWNLWAQQLTGDEVNGFVNNVVKLRNLMYCPKCNKFIQSIPQIDNLWSCKCQDVNYKTA